VFFLFFRKTRFSTLFLFLVVFILKTL